MEVTESTVIDAPVPAVWALLEDFGAIKDWWPKDGPITIDKVTIEGDGIGMIRHIYNTGMDTPVSERLDFLDSENHTLILSIVGDRPGGITAYVAIGRLSALTEDQCRIDYKGYVTAEPGQEARVEKNIKLTWQRMFAGLKSKSEYLS